MPVPAARRWDQERFRDARGSPGMEIGWWAAVDFSQWRSGKGKQTERYPESMQSTWDFPPLLRERKKKKIQQLKKPN